MTGQSNLGATDNTAVSSECDVDTASGIWYKVSFPIPATLAVSTCKKANFDTQISIYSGECGSFKCKADADADDTDGCDYTTSVVVNVQPSDIYILMDGFGGDVGNFTLDVNVTILVVSLMETTSSIHYILLNLL